MHMPDIHTGNKHHEPRGGQSRGHSVWGDTQDKQAKSTHTDTHTDTRTHTQTRTHT